MSDTRIYVDLPLAEGQSATLPEGAYRHLIVVLKRIRGDKIVLFNGQGSEFDATIATVGKNTLTCSIDDIRHPARESNLQITLAQAVSKGERMDFAIQKAVELGVAEVQPLLTDHVVVRLNEERWARKLEHWQSIAVSAAEQSGRLRVPKILPVVDLRDWFTAIPQGALRLVLAPGAANAVTPKFQQQPIVLLVGPEGGLSEMELRLTDLAGFTPLALGPRTLRTETAGIVALSVVQSLWGDLASALKGK